MAVSLPDAKALEGKKEQPEPAPQSRDFFWDSIILYVVAVIVSLVVIDVVFEFARGSGVQCYMPNDTNQSLLEKVNSYVTEFCSGQLPFLQFLPTFIAVHAALILAPHYVFFNAYGADLDFFFRHVSKIERTREQTTGDYPRINYIVSQQMDDAFKGSIRGNGMFRLYLFKVVAQFWVCVIGAIIVPTSMFERDEQTVHFECPSKDEDTFGDKWPLPEYEKVMCVFSPLHLLHNIWWMYLLLLAVVAAMCLVNLYQLVRCHVRELGFESYAEFSFQTGMPYEYYSPTMMDLFSKVFPTNIALAYDILRGSDQNSQSCEPGSKQRRGIVQRIVKSLSIFLHPLSPYVIESDYDFLMIRLFRTDGGLAFIMKELHILRLLREKNRDDVAKTFLYRTEGAGIDKHTKEFLRAGVGWELPDKFREFQYENDEENYKPALDSKTLVLPPNIRGIVMGCALRSEGGFQPIQNLSLLAKRWEKVALKLQENMIDPPSEDARKQLQDRIDSLNSRASKLEGERREYDQSVEELKEKKELLKTLQNQLEKIVNDVKLDQQLISITNEAKLTKKNNTDEQAGTGSYEQQSKVTKIRPGSVKEIVASRCDSLVDGLNEVSILQDQITAVRHEIKTLEETVEDSSIDMDEQRLLHNLKKFEREQQRLAKKQKEVVLTALEEEAKMSVPDQNRIKQLRAHLSCALQQSGYSLINALVIGFDMESEGLASALARVFPRVGAINFSSSYADYDNPFKVLNSSDYYLNAVIPEYAVASDALIERDLPEELKHSADKVLVSKMVLDAMTEVWKKNYIVLKRKDEVEKLETGQEGTRAREIGIYKSNFVVIGPLSSTLHITTVDRILSRHQAHLAHNAVILVLKPVIAQRDFYDYQPPQEDYEKIYPMNIKLGKPEPWLKATTEGEEVGSALNPLRIGVEHTIVQYYLNMFRRK